MNDTKNAGNGGGERRIDRYVLHERISLHSPTEQFDGYRQFPTELWRGHDDVLDRAVSIRLIRKDDSRLNRVLGAARAAPSTRLSRESSFRISRIDTARSRTSS